jgi:Bcr/CflA subfamily drug resistance transporter
MKTQNRLYIMMMITAAIALGNAGSTLYLPAMPDITLALHTSPAMMKLSLSLFLIGFGVSQLIHGPLSDAFGRRIMLVIGLIIFIFGSLLSAFAQDISFFLAGRLIEGLGIGAANAVGYALIRDIYSGPQLTSKLSYISVFVGSMPLLAPVIGGYLVEYINWQACFFMLALCAILLLILKTIFLPETLVEPDQFAWHPKVAFKKFLTLLSNRSYLGFNLVTSIGFAGIFTTGSILPFLLVNDLGVSTTLYGWIAGIPAIGYLSASFISGKLSARYSLTQLIFAGGIIGLIALGTGLLVNLSMPHYTIYSLITPLVFFMFSIGFLVPTGTSGAMEPFPKLAGAASALLCATMFLCASLLTAIGSHLNINGAIPLFLLLSSTSILVLLALCLVKAEKRG